MFSLWIDILAKVLLSWTPINNFLRSYLIPHLLIYKNNIIHNFQNIWSFIFLSKDYLLRNICYMTSYFDYIYIYTLYIECQEIPLDNFYFAHAHCWMNCSPNDLVYLYRTMAHRYIKNPLKCPCCFSTYSFFREKIDITRTDFVFCKLSTFGDVLFP